MVRLLTETHLMTKLNDTQLILLSSAAARDEGSIFPLTASLADAGARATKAMFTLLKNGLVEERETSDAGAVHRTDGDLSFGLFLSGAGRAAINIEDSGGEGAGGETPPSPAPASAVVPTKAATVLALLQRHDGATLAELITATGWLPHTTRAALTGIRKKGHAVERTKRADETCYRIVSAA
jgi:hypothetical protein